MVGVERENCLERFLGSIAEHKHTAGVLVLGPSTVDKTSEARRVAQREGFSVVTFDPSAFPGGPEGGDAVHSFLETVLERGEDTLLLLEGVESFFGEESEVYKVREILNFLASLQGVEQANFYFPSSKGATSTLVLGTATDIERLPPEFLKGYRWTGIFSFPYGNEWDDYCNNRTIPIRA